MEKEKTRYSDVELQEFKELILEKLRMAREEFLK
jgi:DnaK suppressor protein